MVEFADVRRAAERIEGAIVATPTLPSRTLSDILGCEIHIKFENLQFTASFKERGALNRLLNLTQRQRANGVIAMSAGNHAQGVAYHARRLGIDATIVMPRATPFTKVARTTALGATIELEGDGLKAAAKRAHLIAAQRNLTLIHPYDDPFVIAGQGTVAVEMLAAVPDLDVIIVPVGGGGLISGMALAAKALAPGVRIIGVQSRTYPSMAKAVFNPTLIAEDGPTIAEGIAVKSPGKLTRKMVRKLVDGIVVVDEAAIEQAVALLLDVEKTVAEGAGAAALAAIIAEPHRFKGLRVGVPVTGGNIDLRVLASVAMRSLVRAGQLVRLQVAVPDLPCSLAQVTRAIGDGGGNILEVAHDRLSLALTAKTTAVEAMVEVRHRQHGVELAARLTALGYRTMLVEPASELIDPPLDA